MIGVSPVRAGWAHARFQRKSRPPGNRMGKHIVNNRGFPNMFIEKPDEEAHN